MLAALLACALAAGDDAGPQFATNGPGIYKIERGGSSGAALRYFNAVEWTEKPMATGGMRCVWLANFGMWTSTPNSSGTVLAHYNRPTGDAWEQVQVRYADAGPFTPLFLGIPAKSKKVFGIVGTGEEARLCFFESQRRRLTIASPAFPVTRGWRSLLLLEEAAGIINTADGLKDVFLQGDNSAFSATMGQVLPTVEEGIATDSFGNALIGAPMGNMFFFVDKKGQLGQFFLNSSRKWVYKNQEVPPRGWSVLAKSRPVTVENGSLAVQVENKEKGLEGVAFKTFKGGEWFWEPRILSLPEGVKFDAKVDLSHSLVGTHGHYIHGLGEDGKFYRVTRNIGETWKGFEGPF